MKRRNAGIATTLLLALALSSCGDGRSDLQASNQSEFALSVADGAPSICGEPDPIPLLTLTVIELSGDTVSFALENHSVLEADVGVAWRISSERNSIHGCASFGPSASESISFGSLSLSALGADLGVHLGPGELVARPAFTIESRCVASEGTLTIVHFLATGDNRVSLQIEPPPLFASPDGEALANAAGLRNDSGATLNVHVVKRSDSANYMPEEEGQGGSP